MSLIINPPPPSPVPTDVSRNALSVARMIDRLEAGKYTITVIKTEGEANRWQIEIVQPVTLHKKDLTGSAASRVEPYQSADG